MANDQSGIHRVVLVTDEALQPDARTLHMATILARAGLDCRVVSLHPARPGSLNPHSLVSIHHRPEPDDNPGENRRHGRFRLSRPRFLARLRDARRRRRYLRDLTAFLIRAEADAYHACGSTALEVCRRAARHHLARLVHDVDYPETTPAVRPEPVTDLVDLADVDAVITTSDRDAALWRERDLEHTLVFRNLPRWRSRSRPATHSPLRARMGLADHVPLLACVVDDAVRTSLPVLIQCFQGLPGHHLALVGTTPASLPAALRARLDAGSLADRVTWLDSVRSDRLPSLLAGIDALLLPLPPTPAGASERLPGCIYSAAMAGIPVVTSFHPTCRDFVLGHGLGRVCHPTDPAAWAHAIQSVLAARHSRLHPRAFERLRQDLSRDREAREAVRFYHDLLGRPRCRDDRPSSVVSVPPGSPSTRPSKIAAGTSPVSFRPRESIRPIRSRRAGLAMRVARTPFASRPADS